MPQDSIIYLYLITNAFKFYCRASYIYSYSSLFDGKSSHNKRRMTDFSGIKPHAGSLINKSPESLSSRQADFMNRSVQLIAKNSSPRSQRKLAHQTSNASDLTVKKNKLFTYYMNMVSLGSSYFATGQKSDRMKLNIELMELILNNNSSNGYMGLSGGSNSGLTFDQSDMNIVLNLLKTLQIKQIYMYNLAMHNKKLMDIRDEIKTEESKNQQQVSENETIIKAVNGSSAASHTFSASNYSTYLNNLSTLLRTEIQFPLLVEYEENVTILCKKK
jgi:hypothetical protein